MTARSSTRGTRPQPHRDAIAALQADVSDPAKARDAACAAVRSELQRVTERDKAAAAARVTLDKAIHDARALGVTKVDLAALGISRPTIDAAIRRHNQRAGATRR